MGSSDMQMAQEQLQKKNQELFEMYREKSKKFTQITNLYNLLKSRATKSQMQTAASDSVSRALDSIAPSRHRPSTSSPNRPTTIPQVPQTPSSKQYYPIDKEGVEQLHRFQRSGTGSSKGGKRNDISMPPPSRPAGTVGAGKNYILCSQAIADHVANVPNATPQHRTRLTGSVRPPTALSNLPQDDAMFERFNSGIPLSYNPSGNYFADRNHASMNQESLDFQVPGQGRANQSSSHTPVPSTLRNSFFDNTTM